MATSPQPFKLFGATITTITTIPSSPSPKPTDAAPKPSGLVCPRCKSRETKFCYFNNYNVNQPRHFCRSCHRYWTAGGALRNVPVGAGRRKHRPTPDHALVQHWLLAHDNAAAATAFQDPIL